MSRRAPAECRARAGGGDAPGRRERTAPVELRSLDLLNGVRRQPLGYNRPTVQALPYSTIPRVYEVEIVTVLSVSWKLKPWGSQPAVSQLLLTTCLLGFWLFLLQVWESARK